MLDTRYLTRVWKNAIPAFAFFLLLFLRRGCDDNRTLGTCCSLLIGRRHAPKPTLNISFRNERGTITGFLSRPSQLGNWIKQPALFKKEEEKKKTGKERERSPSRGANPSQQASSSSNNKSGPKPSVCCYSLTRGVAARRSNNNLLPSTSSGTWDL